MKPLYISANRLSKDNGIPQTRRSEISFGLILSVGFLLLISLTITTIIAVMSDWVMNHWPNIVLIIFYVLNLPVPMPIISLEKFRQQKLQ